MTHPQRAENRTDGRCRRRATALVAILVLLGCLPAAAQPDSGRLAVAAVDFPALRGWDAAVDRQLRAGDLRRYGAQPNLYAPTRQSERFSQYHEGIPVYGADLIRQTDGGVTTAIVGSLYTGIDLDTTPGLTSAEARAVFDGMEGPPFGLAATPRLWVFPLGDGGYTLAWEGVLLSFRSVFIDADSGETLFEASRIHHQTVGIGNGVLGDPRKLATETMGGTFRARDPLRPATIATFDLENDENRFLDTLRAMFDGAPAPIQDLAADDDNVWEDPVVVDVHPGLGWSYDYLATQLGWAGIDGRNGEITAFVHPVNPARVLTALNECVQNATDVFTECVEYLLLLAMIDNAAYFPPFPSTPDSTGLMVFGEPFMLPRPLTALDVAAHEMAHGVTWFTAALGNTLPPNEPGALNEAFSDIIATATEFYIQEPGAGPLRADYLMGEDAGVTVRSLRDPQELPDPVTGQPYPDHYDNLFRGEENNGGTHINATILGHAYFLAIEGGVNRTSGMTVTGVGHEHRLEIERAFFNAWVSLVPSFADHGIVARALVRSATDLYGPDAAATRALASALRAVGILP